MTMSLIATATITVSGTNVSFTDIPQTFTDLYVLASLRGLSTSVSEGFVGETVSLVANGTGSGYNLKRLQGYGIGVRTSSDTYVAVGWMPTALATSNTFANSAMYIPNYTSNTDKTMNAESVAESNQSGVYMNLSCWSFSTSSPITQLGLGASTSGLGFAVGSTVSLYGITAGSDGIVTTS